MPVITPVSVDYQTKPIPIQDIIMGEIGVWGRERASAILSILTEDRELERPIAGQEDWKPTDLNTYLVWELLESLNNTTARGGFSDSSEYVSVERKCAKRPVKPSDFKDLRNKLLRNLEGFLNTNNADDLDNLPKEAKKVTITRFTANGAVCTDGIYLPNGSFEASLKGQKLPEVIVIPAPELDDGGNRDVYRQLR
ncbi:MAG: hypothetical protein PHU71_02035 [Candidatus Gracilibacteria bacterium]|nr:hypothetical protein [Candidatus Gracilibacteria bacterium]